MLKKVIVAVLVLTVSCAFEAAAQMSDESVVEYIIQAVEEGKSRIQVATELVSMGVSSSQIKRVYVQYKDEIAEASKGSQTMSRSQGSNSTERGVRTNSAVSKLKQRSGVVIEVEDEEETAKDKSVKDKSVKDKKTDADKVIKKDDNARDEKIAIYGHDLFNNKKLSFEPNDNAATPDNYVLGPGDQIIIDIWGENEATIKQTISPEGNIMISQIGPVQLGGLTIDAARSRIKKELSRKYAALGQSTSQISLTLAQNRSIMVNVMGEVNVPGTYRLSSFSTVFNAIYCAGGVTEVGSVRQIKVGRGSSIAAVVDIYQYLFNGFAASDIPLKDGDVIVVPACGSLVGIKGKVKRPMYYEMVPGETLAQALEYAGGFAGDAYKGDVSVVRQTGGEQTICSVTSEGFSSFELKDGDSFEVMPAMERFSNKLEVKGAVKRAGVFQFGDDVKTVAQLIKRAGGLREDAFSGRAQIVREKDDLSLEVVAISLGGILDGSSPDVMLKGNDILYVSSVKDIEEKGDFTINGFVAFPGDYPYADNTSVEDLILLAGGLSDGASSVRVDVSRRIKKPESTAAGDKLAEIFTFSIKDGLLVDGKPDFKLQPYDVVSVRRSPTYTEQKTINIIGEVAFPGQYSLESNAERVSDIISRAGGATQFANLLGAVLKRKITDIERDLRNTVMDVSKKSAKSARDTANVAKLEVPDVYNVGLELDKAIAKPGSDFDVLLRDGDELIIPEMPSTVRIQGEVLYPNTVAYIKGKSVAYYLEQAGGFGQRARRGKTYVVYMNGSVSSGLRSNVEPGCEIVVPGKGESREVSAAEVISLGSSAASLSAVILSIINMIK